MKTCGRIIVVVLCAWLVFLTMCNRGDRQQVSVTDTVIVRDTIRDTVLIPKKVYIVRHDTIKIKLPTGETIEPEDSIQINVPIPITRKEYRTKDYNAIIEGFNPKLLSMEVFPTTKTITNTVTKYKQPRLQFGVGVGIGYDPFSQKLHPTINLSLYLPIFTIK